MGFDQPVHWLVIVVAAGMLFGGYKKLPDMARSAGRSMRVFKTELTGMTDDDDARTAAKAARAAPVQADPSAALPTQPDVPTQPVVPAPPVMPAQPVIAAQPVATDQAPHQS